jgi:DNA-binding response OmpR family regulator
VARDARTRILLVQSDRRLRELLAPWLPDARFEVAACPERARDGCPPPEGCGRAEDVDLVVLDLELESRRLPCGIPAWELLQLYRSRDRPVLVLTGRDDLVRPVPGDRLGVLRRPPEREAFLEAVRVLLLGGPLAPAGGPGTGRRPSG